MTLRVTTHELSIPSKREDVIFLVTNYCSFVEIQLSTGTVVPGDYIYISHEGSMSAEEEAEFREAMKDLNLPL